METAVMPSAATSEPTPTVEDYLALLFVFERDGHPAIASRLAEQMGVSLPTASATIRRMVRDGWADVDEGKGKEVRLTPAGRQQAGAVMQRHYLVETLLRDVLDVPWSRIHAEAHAMEHAVSDDTLARMQEKLGHPRTCPHGNPFPGSEAAVERWAPLVDLKPGEGGTISRIHELAEGNGELMAFLEQNGLMPGARFVVGEVMPFNQTLAVVVAGAPIVLGFTTAQWIYVER